MSHQKLISPVRPDPLAEFRKGSLVAELDPGRARRTLETLSVEKTYLFHEPVSTVGRGRRVALDRYVFLGPETGSQPVKLAVFGGLEGAEAFTASAIADFAGDLFANPELATGVHLYLYPSSFQPEEGGRDLYRELWTDSDEAEPYLVERELSTAGFHGVTALLAEPRLKGFSAQLFGPAGALREFLVDRTLERVAPFLPLAEQGDWVASRRLSLTAGGTLKPQPFEAVLKAPSGASSILVVQAFRLALHSILSEYRAASGHASHI